MHPPPKKEKAAAILASYSRNREETRVYMNILKALADQRKKAAQKKKTRQTGGIK